MLSPQHPRDARRALPAQHPDSPCRFPTWQHLVRAKAGKENSTALQGPTAQLLLAPHPPWRAIYPPAPLPSSALTCRFTKAPQSFPLVFCHPFSCLYCFALHFFQGRLITFEVSLIINALFSSHEQRRTMSTRAGAAEQCAAQRLLQG